MPLAHFHQNHGRIENSTIFGIIDGGQGQKRGQKGQKEQKRTTKRTKSENRTKVPKSTHFLRQKGQNFDPFASSFIGCFSGKFQT